MAHVVAEALLNAPQVLGSLSLLFNPTGLVRSVRAGVSDFIGLPLAALQNQSLSQVCTKVWGGCNGDGGRPCWLRTAPSRHARPAVLRRACLLTCPRRGALSAAVCHGCGPGLGLAGQAHPGCVPRRHGRPAGP